MCGCKSGAGSKTHVVVLADGREKSFSSAMAARELVKRSPGSYLKEKQATSS